MDCSCLFQRLKKEKWISQEKKQFTTSLKSTLTSAFDALSLNTASSGSWKGESRLNTAKQDTSQDTETVTDESDKKTLNQSQDFTPQGILKKSRSYECLRTSEKKLNFDASTVGGSDSDSTTSDSDLSDLDLHGPLEPKMPLEVDMEDDFSFHLVQHLVKKTVKRQKSFSKHGEYLDTSSSDPDDSDKEFLESVNYSAQTDSTDQHVIAEIKDKTFSTLSCNNSRPDVGKALNTNNCESEIIYKRNQLENSTSQEIGLSTLQEKRIPDENKISSGEMCEQNFEPEVNEASDTRQEKDDVQSQDDKLFLGKLVLTQVKFF